jgi:hypothetical protein
MGVGVPVFVKEGVPVLLGVIEGVIERPSDRSSTLSTRR